MKKTCRICKGRGKLITSLPVPMAVTCTHCKGKGYLILPDHVVRKLMADKQQLKKQRQTDEQ